MRFPKLRAGWWLTILFFLLLEVAAFSTLDYKYDRLGAILFIHLLPVCIIAAIFKWGPSK